MRSLTLQQKILAVVALVIAVVVFGWCQRREGVKVGAVNQEIKASAIVVTAEKADVQVELKKSVAKRTEYKAARAKVEIKGDTIFADGKEIEMPSVVGLIKVADARGAQDSTSMAKQDLLVGALDHHVDLLEEAKKPRCSTKCGVVIGTVGTVAVVYVAIRIIKAVAHK
jgi:hypothetical protein